MDLANLFDTISSMVMASYVFGSKDIFYWGTLWVITCSIGQLFSSFFDYLNNDAYRTTKFGFHSLFWQIQAWEQFVMTIIIGSENVNKTREGMIGKLFCCIIACILVLISLSMSLLELIQNVFFVVLTFTTIHQLSNEEDYFFFGIICFLYALISLYAVCSSIANSDREEDLMPTGAQMTSKVQEILKPFQNLIIQSIQSNGFPETTSSHILNTSLYVCNGLAALSSIQGSLIHSTKHSVRIPSVMTPGAVFQLYVCSIQAHKGRRFSSLLPFCYAAIWATWTWLQFSASLNDTGNTKGITLGTLTFLIINIFFIILGTDVNKFLVLLTFFMEIMSVSYFLVNWKPLPLPLEVTTLAIFCAVSIYGTVASFTIFVFNINFISLGLFATEKLQRSNPSLSGKSVLPKSSFPESSRAQIIHCTRRLRTLLKLFKDNELCAVPIETLNALIASSKKAGTGDHHRVQSMKLPNECMPLLSKSQSELKSQSQNQNNPPSQHSLQQARNVQTTEKNFENDSWSTISTEIESEPESDSDETKEGKKSN